MLTARHVPDTVLSSSDTTVKMRKYGDNVGKKKGTGTARAKTCRCGKSVHRIVSSWVFWREKANGGIVKGGVNRDPERVQVTVVLVCFPLTLEFFPVGNGKSLKTFKEGSLFHYFKYLIADFITAHIPF